MSGGYNPYATPDVTPAYAAPVPSGGLTAIGVVGIILGSMGLLTSEFGVGGLIAQPYLFEFQDQALKQAPAEVRDAQTKMNQEMLSLTRRFMVPQIANLVVKFIVEIALIVGSIMVLKRRARRFAVGAIAAAIISDLISFAVTSFVQMEMSPIMERSMSQMAKAQPGAANAPDLSGFMKLGTMLGIAVGIVWLLVKLGFFGWALAYLQRDRIQAAFPQRA